MLEVPSLSDRALIHHHTIKGKNKKMQEAAPDHSKSVI